MIATDAAISIAIGLTKFAVFGIAGVVTRAGDRGRAADRRGGVSGRVPREVLVARLPLHVHTAMLDAVVIIGGAVMVANAFLR